MTREELLQKAHKRVEESSAPNAVPTAALQVSEDAIRQKQEAVPDEFDVNKLNLDPGLPFSAKRKYYLQTLDLLHRERLAWLKEQCTHVRATSERLNRAALAQVTAIATTIVMKTLAFEEVQRESAKTRAIIELWHDFNRASQEILAQAGVWPDSVVIEQYDKMFQRHKAAAERIANFTFSLEIPVASAESA